MQVTQSDYSTSVVPSVLHFLRLKTSAVALQLARPPKATAFLLHTIWLPLLIFPATALCPPRYAFAVYSTKEDAESAAKNMDGRTLGDRTVKVRVGGRGRGAWRRGQVCGARCWCANAFE